MKTSYILILVYSIIYSSWRPGYIAYFGADEIWQPWANSEFAESSSSSRHRRIPTSYRRAGVALPLTDSDTSQPHSRLVPSALRVHPPLRLPAIRSLSHLQSPSTLPRLPLLVFFSHKCSSGPLMTSAGKRRWLCARCWAPTRVSSPHATAATSRSQATCFSSLVSLFELRALPIADDVFDFCLCCFVN